MTSANTEPDLIFAMCESARSLLCKSGDCLIEIEDLSTERAHEKLKTILKLVIQEARTPPAAPNAVGLVVVRDWLNAVVSCSGFLHPQITELLSLLGQFCNTNYTAKLYAASLEKPNG